MNTTSLATNIRFFIWIPKEILRYVEKYYPDSDIDKWKGYFSYMKRQNYNPTGCHVCKYADNCNHATNSIRNIVW